MKTHSPIATITYVDIEFLKNTLDGLFKLGDIDFYCYIKHQPEDIGLKEHIHLYIEPSHIVDTKDLQFLQNDAQGTIIYHKSKFIDWFFYCEHNEAYLQDKGMQKKYTYTFSDFISNNSTEFLHRVEALDINLVLSDKYKYTQKIRYCVANNLPFSWLLVNDYIPLNMINQAQQYYILLGGKLYG